jgi:DNA-binding winged helix-turn-helix (wHTH) protein
VTLPQHYRFGPFHVDPSERVRLRGNEAIALTHKAFGLLLLLLGNARRTIPKAELMTNGEVFSNERGSAALARRGSLLTLTR